MNMQCCGLHSSIQSDVIVDSKYQSWWVGNTDSLALLVAAPALDAADNYVVRPSAKILK